MDLNQITVPVTDVERSIDFYEKLGLKLIVKALPDYARFECPEGYDTFSLHRTDLQCAQGIWVYFEVQNLDDYVNNLIKKNVIFEELPNDKSWL